MLIARQELALIDLREEAPFALGHPLFAAQMSAGRLEMEIFDRIPRKNVTIALYDDGEGLVAAAAVLIQSLGYSDVRVLEGGLQGWRDAGYELFQDVNSFSKAFGELVEHRRNTPSLAAHEVQALIAAKANIEVMDARRFDEYSTMSIPTSTSVPGAELVLKAPVLAAEPDTMIIVNCAGRTRSIIGTQSLVNAGISNPVFALRNGTIGWVLAGQALETGQQRQAPETTAADQAIAAQRARETAYRAGVRHVTRVEAALLEEDTSRTLYRFDVRSPEEYREGHLHGYINTPGGQLVQETDMKAPVRGARILLADPLGSRADMTASWLAQMGWEVYVLDGGFDAPLERGDRPVLLPPHPEPRTISLSELDGFQPSIQCTLIDLATSREHGRGHIPGARFALPIELDDIIRHLGSEGVIVLTSPDGKLGHLAAARHMAQSNVHVLDGGTASWIDAGRAVATGLDNPLSEPRDVYKRPYEGTDNAVEAMQGYLDWEFGLVEQLKRDGTHGFFVI